LYQVVVTGEATPFIELPFVVDSTNNLQTNLQITVFPGSNAALASPSSFFNATQVIANSFGPVALTQVANSYQLVAIVGDSAGTGFGIQQFDVTPANGQTTHEFIDLIETVPSLLDSAPAAVLPAFQLTSSSTTGGSFACSNVVSFPNQVEQVNSLVTASLSMVTGGSCCGATPVNNPTSPVVVQPTSGPVSASCGKRVTLLLGRAVQIVTPSCSIGSLGTTSTCNLNNGTSVVAVGGLHFVGDTFFETVPADSFPTPITFDITACACPSPAIPPTCSNCDILAALTGAPGVSSVLTKLTNITSTLNSIKNLEHGLHNLIVRKFKKL